MKQAGSSRTEIAPPAADKASLRILLLCTGLVVTALLAGFISTLLVQNAFEDLEADREQMMRHRMQVSNYIAGIERNLGQARAVIGNILYKTNHPHTLDSRSDSLGALNGDIRALQKLLAAESLVPLSNEFDRVASELVVLHYSAENWRTQYVSHMDETGMQQPLARVRDSLDEFELQVASATLPNQPRQGQPLKETIDVLPNTSGAHEQAFQNQYPAHGRTFIGTILSDLTDIERHIDSMANSDNLDELAETGKNGLEPKIDTLRQHLRTLTAIHGVAHPLDARLVENIAAQLFGHAAADPDSTTNTDDIPLYDALVRGITLQNEREKLNDRLDVLTGVVSNNLARVSAVVQEHIAQLDTIANERSAKARGNLLLTQISSAALFLLIGGFILQAVRNQVNQLTTLKKDAEDASDAKNRFMQRLQASETRQRTIMDTMSSALITTDEDGNIETFNTAAEQLFGYRADEIIGKNALTLIPDRKQTKYFVAFMQLMESGKEPTLQKDIRIIAHRRDGGEFPASLAVSDMIIDGRRIYNGIVMDITDRCEVEARIMEAKEKAEASDRAKSEFLATMSHEIRTPMNGIIGMTDLLLKSRLNSTQLRLASRIQQSGRLLLHLINDILDLSRIEANRLQLEPEPFDIYELVTETGLLFHEQARKQGLELHCNIAPAMHNIWIGDTTRLRQIIINLMANALKFTHTGSVTLALEISDETQQDACLRISVKDTGIGISNAAQAHIFESFSQADGSTTRRYGGSGLGLTICRQLVDLMGGNIGVNSASGAGSEFWFTVRLPRAEAAAMGTGHLRIERSRSHNLDARILLVEDNLVNREVATYMLESMRCQVTVAADGVEALSLLETNDFELVLMDCQMPVMDGYETTREIRARESNATGHHIPIVALTANAMSDARDKCLAAGMDDYLSKPLTMEAMYATLKDQLDRSRSGNARQALAVTPARAVGSRREQTLNPAYLDEFRTLENGDHLADRIINLYLQKASGYLQELRNALLQDDAQALSRTAHMFRSGNAQLGAEVLAGLCSRLDRLGRSGSTQGAGETIRQVEQEYERVSNALSHARASGPRGTPAALEILH